MREKKTLLMLTITLFLGAAIASTPVKAQDEVEFYVKMPNGWIPGVPVGELVMVEIWIDSPEDAGIIGWGISFAVDPNVLTIGHIFIFPPPDYWWYTAEGEFLTDWCTAYNWTKGTMCIDGIIDQTAGTIEQYACMVVAWTELPLGAGAGGSGRILYIYLTSKSQTAFSLLDITMAKYFTTEGGFDADVITDGFYNCCIPEFPSGTEAAATIGLTAAVAYVWLRKRKTKPTIAKRFTI